MFDLKREYKISPDLSSEEELGFGGVAVSITRRAKLMPLLFRAPANFYLYTRQMVSSAPLAGLLPN